MACLDLSHDWTGAIPSNFHITSVLRSLRCSSTVLLNRVNGSTQCEWNFW